MMTCVEALKSWSKKRGCPRCNFEKPVVQPVTEFNPERYTLYSASRQLS